MNTHKMLNNPNKHEATKVFIKLSYQSTHYIHILKMELFRFFIHLVFRKQRKMEKDLERLGIRRHHNKLRDTPVQGLRRCTQTTDK